MGIGKNLRDLRTAAGLSGYALAKRTGNKISASHIGQIESGKIRKIETPTAELLATALGVSVERLISGTVRPLDHDEPRDEHTTDVPLLGVSAGGSPIEVEEMKHETYSLLHHLYKPGRYIIRLVGSSMWPTYHSGDLLLIDPKERVPDGKTALIRVNGETTVKRVFKRKRGGYELKADNPTFPSVSADESDEVQILGRVLRIVEGERE